MFFSDIQLLKNQIMYAIEQITLQGMNMANISGVSSKNNMLSESNDLSSQSGLTKEYKKLSMQLKQLQIIERRTSKQVNDLRKDETEVLHEIKQFSNLEVRLFCVILKKNVLLIFLKTLRMNAAEKMEELGTNLQELKDKRRTTDGVFTDAQKRNKEMKVILTLFCALIRFVLTYNFLTYNAKYRSPFETTRYIVKYLI